MMNTKHDTVIRWMIRRELADVLDIERQSFDDPWTEDEFIETLRRRSAIGMVVEHDRQILGFVIYELHKDVIEILNLAIHPNERRRGYGSQVIAKLVEKLVAQRRKRITLAVRESNLAAQLFFKSQGFLAVDVDDDHFLNGETAYLMQWDMSAHMKGQ